MCSKSVAVVLLICGWLNVQSTEAFGISSFGKANTDPPKPETTTPSSARPCSQQAHCAGIRNTSCVRTHYDSTTLCLCGDNLPPVNGRCDAFTKALYHVCANNNECNDGLICGTPNITSSAPSHLLVHASTPQDKICLCDTENGFTENEHTCNDAVIIKTSLFIVFIISCLIKIIVH